MYFFEGSNMSNSGRIVSGCIATINGGIGLVIGIWTSQSVWTEGYTNYLVLLGILNLIAGILILTRNNIGGILAIWGLAFSFPLLSFPPFAIFTILSVLSGILSLTIGKAGEGTHLQTPPV